MRNVLRRAAIGATAFFAATAFAAPAFAAETTSDLELQIQGIELEANVTQKVATFTIANHGPQAADQVKFTIDTSALDASKVTFEWTGASTCPATGDLYQCQYVGAIGANETWDEYFTLKRVGSSTGAAGSLTITVEHANDLTVDNNTKTVDVMLSDKTGVDLWADALDIWAAKFTDELDAGEPEWGTPVEPGAETRLYVFITNQGSVAANGVKMTIKLPEHVTFVGSEVDCESMEGASETTCTYVGEIPAGDPEGYYWFRVKVADDVAGPVVLGGGQVVVTDIPVQGPTLKALSVPRNLINTLNIQDVDPTDNSDEFAAHVGKKADQGGTGGGLPVTGAQVNLIAGVGLGVIVIGGALFFITRRRKVTA